LQENDANNRKKKRRRSTQARKPPDWRYFLVYRGIIERYRAFLPVSDSTPCITLLEGATPLIPAPRLAAWIGAGIDLYLKYEGMNPTGSFKDRGMTLAVSKAVEEGMRTVICASTGNTSASAAAYAARAGLACHVLIPGGKIAQGKLAQALMHGGNVLAIEGNFDEALCLVREVSRSHPIALVNSVNPFRLQGQKTAAFEIVDTLGDAPDYHALPVGNAGNITAYWMGFKEYHARGVSRKLPRMLGFQAAGAAPLVDGAPVAHPETVATAIRIGNPASWEGAIAARDESGGRIEKVTDEEILEAYRAVAALEGVFVEPACAAPLAGLKKLAQRGYFTQPVTITATMTGHGLKDPGAAVNAAAASTRIVPATRDAVLNALGF
jgi:threonine synthase